MPKWSGNNSILLHIALSLMHTYATGLLWHYTDETWAHLINNCLKWKMGMLGCCLQLSLHGNHQISKCLTGTQIHSNSNICKCA